MVKNLPAMQETWVQSLCWGDPPEKGMATHCSILAWRIPRTGEPGELQSMGLQRVRHDWLLPLNNQSSDHHATLDAVCTVSTVIAAIYYPAIIFISSFNAQRTPWVGYKGQPHFIDKETEAESLTCLVYCWQVVGKTHRLSEFVIPLREITKNLWVILDSLLLPLHPFNQQYLPTLTPNTKRNNSYNHFSLYLFQPGLFLTWAAMIAS